jgi:hypothetical protein
MPVPAGPAGFKMDAASQPAKRVLAQAVFTSLEIVSAHCCLLLYAAAFAAYPCGKKFRLPYSLSFTAPDPESEHLSMCSVSLEYATCHHAISPFAVTLQGFT